MRGGYSAHDDSLRAFVVDVVGHVGNPFTILSFGLALIVPVLVGARVVSLSGTKILWATSAFAYIAVAIAAFDAWRGKVRALPGPGDVASSLETARVEVSGRNTVRVTAAVYVEPLGQERVFLANRRTAAIVAIDALGLAAELAGQWQTPRASNATTDESGVLLNAPARVTFEVNRPLDPPVSGRQWESGPPRSSVAVLTVRCSGAEADDEPLIDESAELPLHGDTFLWEKS